MMASRKSVAVLAAALSLAAPSAIAQTTAESPPSAGLDETGNMDIGPLVKVGADVMVRRGQRAEDVVVILGSALIEGDVDGDVVVLLGEATLTGTSRVKGDVVVVLGRVNREPGAAIDNDVVVLDVAASDWFEAAIPWLTEGLLWGRPIVPHLPWVWGIAAVLVLVYLVVNLVFERAVRVCAQALSDKPLSTSLAGVLVLVLLGPVSVLLCISVIGIGVVPFLWCAVLLATLLGRVSVARWTGNGVVAEESPSSRLQAARSLLIGLAVICLAYMVPVLGLLTWAMLGVFGLGAASTAFVSGLRREIPVPPAPAGPGFAPPAPLQPPDPTPEMGADESVARAGTGSPGGLAMATDPSVFQWASFLRRLGAGTLDVLLVVIGVAWLNLESGAIALLFLAYHVFFWAWKSTTVGGIICRLRVARIDGAPIRFSEALIRGLASILSVAVAGLGWVWILWHSNRQAWHDKIAGTLVVQVPSHWPLP